MARPSLRPECPRVRVRPDAHDDLLGAERQERSRALTPTGDKCLEPVRRSGLEKACHDVGRVRVSAECGQDQYTVVVHIPAVVRLSQHVGNAAIDVSRHVENIRLQCGHRLVDLRVVDDSRYPPPGIGLRLEPGRSAPTVGRKYRTANGPRTANPGHSFDFGQVGKPRRAALEGARCSGRVTPPISSAPPA